MNKYFFCESGKHCSGGKMKDNIIKFRNKNKLTDSDINGLFQGLVKLIRRAAMEDASQYSILEKENIQRQFQENILLINQKDEEIEKLKKENKLLRIQIKSKNMRILHLTCMAANKINNEKISL